MAAMKPDDLTAFTLTQGTEIGAVMRSMSHTTDSMEKMRALVVALALTVESADRLRAARDTLIAEIAAEGRFGFARIGEAAGVAATYASRKARAAGVPPRHIREVREPVPDAAENTTATRHLER